MTCDNAANPQKARQVMRPWRVRKATHPVRAAVRAATPKSVKRLERAAHPVSLAELKLEDAAVNALRSRPKRQGKRSR